VFLLPDIPQQAEVEVSLRMDNAKSSGNSSFNSTVDVSCPDHQVAEWALNLLFICHHKLSTDGLKCAYEVYSVEQRCPFAVLLQSVSWEKLQSEWCKKNPSSTVLCETTIYRTLENFWIIGSLHDENERRKPVFFSNEVLLTYVWMSKQSL